MQLLLDDFAADWEFGLLEKRAFQMSLVQSNEQQPLSIPPPGENSRPPLSWLSPKTEVRPSPIHGRGLFATSDFAKDEIVGVKGGHIVTRAQLAGINARLGPVEIQIAEDLFIAPVTADERESSMLYSNHSCAANLGMRGDIVFVALRDIRAGEELTHDWCVTDDDTYEVTCRCGSAECRGTLTGKDWQRPDLHARYDGYFSSYLTSKIQALRQ